MTTKTLRATLAGATALVVAAAAIVFMTWHEAVSNWDFFQQVIAPLSMIVIAVMACFSVGRRPKELVAMRTVACVLLTAASAIGSFLMAHRAFAWGWRIQAQHSPTGTLFTEGAWMIVSGGLQVAAVVLFLVAIKFLRTAPPVSSTEQRYQAGDF